MIYIIISNVGMAIMMIFLYFRYSRFRLTSSSEIKELRQKNEAQAEELRNADSKILSSTKNDTEKVESLLREVTELRKEKENEIKLRLGAEKQIELTLQKTNEIERRMNDWRIMQDAVMRDSKDAIMKVGNDLYKKLSDNYKIEVETNKNLIGKVSKNITDFMEKISAMQHAPAAAAHQAAKPAAPAAAHKEAAPAAPKMQEIQVADPSKKLIADLVETAKASGRMANKDYFLPGNFDEQKAKLMLCEFAFLSGKTLDIIDFKASRYFAEHEQLKVKNKVGADMILRQKLDKYFAYLENPKYRESIMKVMSSTKAKFEKTAIVIALRSKADLQVIKEIRYFEKAHKMGFEVMDFDGVNNIVL